MPELMPLLDKQGNKLEPVTLGECVTMGSGDNLDVLMSKNQMFTPTITQDKSMFKVGTGVDVDYSANVKDGAYESLVFKGKSLVNHVRLNNRITSKAAIEIEEQPIDHTKAYLLKVRINEVPVFTSESDSQLALKIQYFHTGSTKGFISIPNNSMVKGYELTKVVTPVPESDTNKKFVLWMPRYVSGTLDVDVMFIPYQDGMENWDIPFFTGLCDVKMPILRTVGKNLFDGQIIRNACLSNDGRYYNLDGAITFAKMVYVKGLKEICLSISNSYDSRMSMVYSLYDKNKNFICRAYGNYFSGTGAKFSISDDVYYLKATFHTFSTTAIGDDVDIKIQLEESLVATPYEDYKTNILRTSEEIVLRSVGDIKDSYNALTGEYVQRIVEYVFNGSESEAWHFSEMKGDNYRFGINLPTFGNKSADKTALICDRLKVGDIAQEPKQEQIATYNHDSYFELRITLSPSTLASNNVDELRRYLQANPIAIQYAVAEPTTAIIKPYTTPFAYQDGHVILESGHEGQSLLPEIEYGVVTGRTGQVVQNSKILRKHEQQISSIEDLLLTQIVEMDYERLLLQFDYDLQMLGLSE